MLPRTVAWLAIVGVLVLWLSGPLVPGWLIVTAVAAAVPMGVVASSRQKRRERDWVRAGWRRLTSRS